MVLSATDSVTRRSVDTPMSHIRTKSGLLENLNRHARRITMPMALLVGMTAADSNPSGRALGEDLAAKPIAVSQAEEMNFSRFVSRNIEKLGPLSPPPFLSPPHNSPEVAAQAQAQAKEKLDIIRQVWEAVNEAVAAGIIPADCLGIENYTNLETSVFLKELEAASKKPGWKDLPDDLMRKLLSIDSTNIIAALFSLYQQELLSPEELVTIAKKTATKTFQPQSWRQLSREISTSELIFLAEEVLGKIAIKRGLQPPEIYELEVDDDTGIKHSKLLRDEKLLVVAKEACAVLHIADFFRGTGKEPSYASIIFPDTRAVARNSVDEAATADQAAETATNTTPTSTGEDK